MTLTQCCHEPETQEAVYMKSKENYKADGEASGKQAVEELQNEILSPIERDIEKFRDPVFLAALMHTAVTERENTNRILRTIVEKLDEKLSQMESRIARLEGKSAEEEILISEVDEEILAFVRERKYASAEEVRRRFGYKGKNAASARLSRMYDMGLLGKKQVGRSVIYFAK